MSIKRAAFIAVGLGFGDCGKGATTDFLARQHGLRLAVRFNGGPQAAHNVITPDGRHHTFSQFGSHSFLPDSHTHLSRYMLINPPNMLREEEHLREVGITHAFDRLSVDEDCVVITPFQRAMGRLREYARGAAAHGSCGQGIGQARSDQIDYGDKILYAGDLRNEVRAKEKLRFVQAQMRTAAQALGVSPSQPEFSVLFEDGAIDWCWQEYSKVPLKIVSGDYLKTLIDRYGSVVFEGAQGIMLDETFGTAPHNTWTDTTCRNADKLLREVEFNGDIRRIGVLRTYYTRHGAGPFDTEDASLTKLLPELHNNDDGFQGAFRVGHFDALLARYAIAHSDGTGHLGKVNELALTHMDAIYKLDYIRVKIRDGGTNPFRFRVFAIKHLRGKDFVNQVEHLVGIPITIVADGPTSDNRVEKRAATSARLNETSIASHF